MWTYGPASPTTINLFDTLTCCIAVVALVAPAAIWAWQRWLTRPVLRASYDHKEPMARKSSRRGAAGDPVYDFHFHVRNTGRSTAESVTATIVEFWYEEQTGKFVRLEEFLPVPLRYASSETVDIHPRRPYYWNIGYLPSRKALPKLNMPPRFDAPGKPSTGLAFWLDIYGAPWHQVNALAPGVYGLKIALHSKNAKDEPILLKISWTGKWRSTEVSMFKQVRIEQVERFY